MDDGGAVSCMMSGAGFLMRAGFGGGNGFGLDSTRFGTVYSMILYEFSEVMVPHEIASSLRSYSETSNGGGSRRCFHQRQA
jgi:hypothetical protein